MLREAIRKLPGVPLLIRLSTEFEDWWFDWRNGTATTADYAEQARKGWETDPANHTYVPIRPKCARRVLNALPLENPRDYTFIDFGCGKGRMLVMASALPFRSVIGVELRAELCEEARLNLKKASGRVSRDAYCVNVNAIDFEFPGENMVLYFFNPFGEEVLFAVLQNLGRSLQSRFRDVVVALDNPVNAHVADGMAHLSFFKEGYGFRIYRSREV
jgi:SAM-dependent methyltransferase